MNTLNDLKAFLTDAEPGTVFEIATSQYADNTTAPGHRFDFYSTGQHVARLVKQGWIEADDRWRYSDVTVLRRDYAGLTCPKLAKAYRLVADARELLCKASDNPDLRTKESEAMAQFADDLMDSKDRFDIA